MKTKLFSTLVACVIITSVFSQSNLNDYKYVIVPNKFDFLKQENQYQLNDLTSFLFKKYGFNVLKEGDTYPNDLLANRCTALKANVIKESTMFKTKLKVDLKNCNDRVVFTSRLGESREKEFKTAYNLALRDAFKSFEALNYSYVPNSKNEATIAKNNSEAKNETAQEIQKLKEEIQSLKKKKEEVVTVKKNETKPPTVVISEPITKVEKEQETVIEGLSNILYAQDIENGFQLVDSSPKVVYRIKNTSLNNVFLVENKNAIIYKNGDDWILEYYLNNSLMQETLNIKF